MEDPEWILVLTSGDTFVLGHGHIPFLDGFSSLIGLTIGDTDNNIR